MTSPHTSTLASPAQTSATDTLYATANNIVEGFRFDEKVVAVFPDMIQRSVPGYSTIIAMISQLTARYAQHGTHCYDLGCSLGAASLAMQQGVGEKNCTIVGIDNSADMIKCCQQIVDASNKDEKKARIQLIEGAIEDIELKPASVIVLNFTLQFLAIEKRPALLQKIARALVPGGVLILSEKLSFNDPRHHELMIDLHHNFKRSQGYSDLEIAQKRQAIENVLIPETFQSHQARLLNAGFSGVELWFQCFNFASMIAFK